MALDPERLREVSTQQLEKRLVSMDKNLFFIDDRKMQQKSTEVMTAIREELDRRKRGIR